MFVFKNSFRNTNRVSNSLDKDQVRRFVEHDLCPNYLQCLSSEENEVYGISYKLDGILAVVNTRFVQNDKKYVSYR